MWDSYCVCTSPTGNQVLVTTCDYSSTLQDVEKPSWAHWALVNWCALQDCWASSFPWVQHLTEAGRNKQIAAAHNCLMSSVICWICVMNHPARARKPGSSFLPTAFSCQFTVQVHKYAIIVLLTVGDSLLVPTCSNLSKCLSWPFGSQWHFSEKGKPTHTESGCICTSACWQNNNMQSWSAHLISSDCVHTSKTRSLYVWILKRPFYLRVLHWPS